MMDNIILPYNYRDLNNDEEMVLTFESIEEEPPNNANKKVMLVRPNEVMQPTTKMAK